MARLAQIVEGLGFGGVWTYVNSGNVVFDAAGPSSAIERALEAELEAAFGFEVTTFVRSAADVRHVVAAEPFAVAPEDTHFVTWLKVPPTPEKRRQLEALTNSFDTLVVAGRDVHWRMRGKSTDSKLRARDWGDIVGRHGSTSRNLTMLANLVRKLDS